MTIREFEAFLDEMDNRLEEANKNGRPLIVEDLTEFIEIVNKTDNLDKLDHFVTDYLYSKDILEKEYEVADFWKYIYREVADLN